MANQGDPSKNDPPTRPNEGDGSKDKGEKTPVVPNVVQPPESTRDPMRVLIDIATNPDLADADKTALIAFSTERFKNRRRMAYASLIAIIASLVLMLIAAFVDGITASRGNGTQIMNSIGQHGGLVGTIEGFLAAIVGAYYGVTAWRPSS